MTFCSHKELLQQGSGAKLLGLSASEERHMVCTSSDHVKWSEGLACSRLAASS